MVLVKQRVSAKAKSKVHATTYRPTLSPPWQTQYQKLLHTLGVDPLVHVGPLLSSGSTYYTRVKVIGNQKARALATLIRPTVQFGNITFKVIVLNQKGSTVTPFSGPFSALKTVRILRLALRSNPLFRFAIVGPVSNVYPVFAKQVVQFYNDNLADYRGNFNGVTAFVFAEVLKASLGNIGIGYSTISQSAHGVTRSATLRNK